MAARKQFNPDQGGLFGAEAISLPAEVAPARPVRAEALFTVRLFAQRAERPAYRKSWSCKVLKSSEAYALEQARDYVRRMAKMAGLQNSETTFIVERNGVVHEYFEYDGAGFRRIEEGSIDEQEQ